MNPNLDITKLPAHVAIIMDGNGRWAKEKGLARIAGHGEGMKSLREIVRHSSDLGIRYLTVYAFSTENWSRPAEEVAGIFKLLVVYVGTELSELKRNNVKINIWGNIDALPKEAKEAAKQAVSETKDNTGLVFNIAINYGGRADILGAVKELIKEGKSAEDICEDDISSRLYSAGIPDPDVIIRTGGECRISNFLIWQSAYSEFIVNKEYWPSFTVDEYEKCLLEYQKRDRRFGGIK